MPVTNSDVQIQTDDKAQVIVSGLKNKKLIFWGDKGNAESIFIGDSSVKRDVANSQKSSGLIVPPFGSANTVFSNYQEIFVDDSDKLYMNGKAGDLLHVIIQEPIELIAAQNIISSLKIPANDPIIARLDQIINLLKPKTA